MELNCPVRFGEFRLDPNTPVLMAGASVVGLPPKALDILLVLVRNAGRVVRKEDLLDLVWPDAIVEEGNIAVHISSLRRALGQNRGSRSAYIETIPRRGYRFAVPVQRVHEHPAARARSGVSGLVRLAAHHMHSCTAEGCRNAAAILRRCMELSPDNASVRTTLAETLLVECMLGIGNREEAVASASSLLSEARLLDRSWAFAYLDRAIWRSAGEWRWDQAEDEAREAVEISSEPAVRNIAETFLGSYLVRRGNIERGTRQMPRLRPESFLAPLVWIAQVDARFLARDFAGSVEVLDNALSIYPHHWLLHASRGRALAALQDFQGALRAFRRARLLYEEPNPLLEADIAHVRALMGKRQSAVSLLSRPHSLSRLHAAKVHCALGDTDGAVARVEEACAQREFYVLDLKQDYRFDRIRSDRRFQAALSRAGI